MTPAERARAWRQRQVQLGRCTRCGSDCDRGRTCSRCIAENIAGARSRPPRQRKQRVQRELFCECGRPCRTHGAGCDECMRIDGIGGIYELISVMRLFSGPFKLDDITRETGRAKRSVLASMQRLRRRGRVAALGRDAEDNARLWRFRG